MSHDVECHRIVCVQNSQNFELQIDMCYWNSCHWILQKIPLGFLTLDSACGYTPLELYPGVHAHPFSHFGSALPGSWFGSLTLCLPWGSLSIVHLYGNPLESHMGPFLWSSLEVHFWVLCIIQKVMWDRDHSQEIPFCINPLRYTPSDALTLVSLLCCSFLDIPLCILFLL